MMGEEGRLRNRRRIQLGFVTNGMGHPGLGFKVEKVERDD